MENQMDKNELSASDKCCGGHGFMHHKGMCALKIIIVIIIMLFVFAAGVRMGVRRSGMGYGAGFGYKQIGRHGNFGGCPMNGFGRERNEGFGGKIKMFSGWGKQVSTSTQIFGAITKVEGNKITIVNNENKQQVIITSASTRIIGNTGEVSLKDLKTGQEINTDGQLNKDNQINALSIVVVK